jgi:hypothetical protein
MFHPSGNLEQKRDRVETIWRDLVRYVNGDVSARRFEKLAVLGFAVTGSENPLDALHSAKELRDGETIDRLAAKYWLPLREVLYGFVPVSPIASLHLNDSPTLSTLEFLEEHTKTRASYFVRNMTFTPIPGSVTRQASADHTVIAGICNFILDQVVLHSGRGEPYEKTFPITVCEKLGCGKLLFVQRAGRARFCSENCRSWTNKNKVPLPAKAEYMRDYRASKKKAQKATRPKQPRKLGRSTGEDK